MAEFDPAPFSLAIVVSLGSKKWALKTQEQRTHLDLKLTILTEQKAAQLSDLLTERRRNLRDVRNHPEAAALQQSANPDPVLAALEECSKPTEQLKSIGEAKQDAETEVPESGSTKLSVTVS